MTFLRLLWYYLWIAPHVLLIAVVVLMIRRKVYKDFPLFLTYSAFEVFQFFTLFAIDHWHKLTENHYLDAFMLGGAIGTALRFGVIHEIFENVFQKYPALNELGRLLFRWATVILLLVSVATAFHRSPDNITRISWVITAMGRAISIVQCGLLMFLFLFSKYFGLTWRNYLFGTALGLGIFASVQLATTAMQGLLGPIIAEKLDFVTMATYHGCVLIWPVSYTHLTLPTNREV